MRSPQRFEARHTETYSGLAHLLRNHVVRDSRYLNWRYVDSPREYRPLETNANGFAVVGFTRRRGLRLALLMELIARSGDCGALLRGALAAARGSGAEEGEARQKRSIPAVALWTTPGCG